MTQTSRLYIRLSQDLKSRLQTLAASSPGTASDLARIAIQRYLDHPIPGIVYAVIAPGGHLLHIFAYRKDAEDFVTAQDDSIKLDPGGNWYWADRDGIQESVSGQIRPIEIM